MKVLALCVANSARSQIAHGWLRALSTPDVEVASAGAEPTSVRPEAVQVMREVGVDLRDHRSVQVTGDEHPDVVVTLCDEQVCPVYPGDVERLSWSTPDPAGRGIAAFREARESIRRRVEAFLEERGKRARFGAASRPLFALRDDVVFLNHGSFGATPREVLAAQRAVVDELEGEPVDFFARKLPGRMRAVAAKAAAFLHADPRDVVFVDNATTGANVVLRSLDLGPGDVIVTTDHAYGSVRNTIDHACARTGATLRIAKVPFPIEDPRQVVDAVRAVIAGAKLAVLDQITSITGLVWPIEELVALCREHGVPVLVDAAHAPGQVPVDLDAIGADWWVGNAHKWLFAPKGCAILHVRRDRHAITRPTVISHGLGKGLAEEFDFVGTRDPSAYLALEAALAFTERHGADRIRAHDFALRERAGAMLCERLGVRPPAPPTMLAAMQTMPVPFPTDGTRAAADAINRRLFEEHRIEAMFMPFGGRVWLRIACQIYNRFEEYERLAEVLAAYAPAP